MEPVVVEGQVDPVEMDSDMGPVVVEGEPSGSNKFVANVPAWRPNNPNQQGDGTPENPIVLGLDSPPPQRKPFSEDDPETRAMVGDDLEDLLTCNICMEIVYKAASCYPCMHKFCHVCILGWRHEKTGLDFECPSCRQPIHNIVRDRAYAHIVDLFLTFRPELGQDELCKRIKDRDLKKIQDNPTPQDLIRSIYRHR